MLTSSLSGSIKWVGSTGIRVGSAHPGEEDAWHACGATVCVGQPTRRRVRPFLTSDFDSVFNIDFISSSSTQWYGQNTILTTFIFEQKSNTPLNHVLLYQLLGIPAPPCADRWCSDCCPLEAKHTDSIFYVVRQITYIHGRESLY